MERHARAMKGSFFTASMMLAVMTATTAMNVHEIVIARTSLQCYSLCLSTMKGGRLPPRTFQLEREGALPDSIKVGEGGDVYDSIRDSRDCPYSHRIVDEQR